MNEMEKLLAGAKFETTPEQDERVLGAATAALARRTAPRPLVFRLAAAAVLVAVCVGAFAVEREPRAPEGNELWVHRYSAVEFAASTTIGDKTSFVPEARVPASGDVTIRLSDFIAPNLILKPERPNSLALANTYRLQHGVTTEVTALPVHLRSTPVSKLGSLPGEDINLVPSGVTAYGYLEIVEGELGGYRYPDGTSGTEEYIGLPANPWLSPKAAPLSTFSIDVDTASYANVRRFLMDGVLPPPAAVRPEEMVNYFAYDYPQAEGEAPFSVTTEMADCPWDPKRRLVHIGLRGKRVERGEIPPRNLVFLLDVSGSMEPADKLPLVQSAMKLLVAELRSIDHVAIVTYASEAGVALEPTPGSERLTLISAIDALSAGGSTNGAGGIQTAYEMARRHFDPAAINRVILATDGDFNVGTTDRASLEALITKERESGVFLTVLGVGTGNLKDSRVEMLADKGNGHYAYLDSILEAKKVLLREAGATFVPIAKDVKIQVEFNPAIVGAYRLLGYENRMLATADFADDSKDAGEIGAGHTVTALYEVFPPGETPPYPGVLPLKYQKEPSSPRENTGPENEVCTVYLRYKAPTASDSRLLEFPFEEPGKVRVEEASDNFAFAAAVAAFGMKLRRSADSKDLAYGLIEEIAAGALGEDPHGDRKEFLDLVKRAAAIDR